MMISLRQASMSPMSTCCGSNITVYHCRHSAMTVMMLCMWAGVWLCKTKTPDRNELKLGTVVQKSSTLCRLLILGSKGQASGLGLGLGSRRRLASPESAIPSCCCHTRCCRHNLYIRCSFLRSLVVTCYHSRH